MAAQRTTGACFQVVQDRRLLGRDVLRPQGGDLLWEVDLSGHGIEESDEDEGDLIGHGDATRCELETVQETRAEQSVAQLCEFASIHRGRETTVR